MNVKIKHLLTILSFALFPISSFAFFCPTNFSQIEEGQTTDQVLATCGKPDVQKFSEKKPEGPQEWNYYVPQTVGTSSMSQTQGTMKTQIVLDNAGNVINISVNGIGVGSTNICGTPIQLGVTKETVKAACGDPMIVNKQQGSTSSDDTAPPKEESTKIITYTYNTDPPVTLTFENGKLVGRQ